MSTVDLTFMVLGILTVAGSFYLQSGNFVTGVNVKLNATCDSKPKAQYY